MFYFKILQYIGLGIFSIHMSTSEMLEFVPEKTFADTFVSLKLKPQGLFLGLRRNARVIKWARFFYYFIFLLFFFCVQSQNAVSLRRMREVYLTARGRDRIHTHTPFAVDQH